MFESLLDLIWPKGLHFLCPRGKYINGDLEYCVRDYHVHKDSHTWEAAMGEKIESVREQSNAVDRYAVAVLKDGTIVGHIQKTSERMYSFLRRDGVI